MSVGSEIFFAALVFALLYLYKITRDRWNWRRGARWGVVGAGSIVALLLLALGGFLIYEKVADKPQKQSGYADLRLGMTMAEVKYVKGYPSFVLENPENQKQGLYPGLLVIDPKDFKGDQHAEDYRSWQYALDDHGTRLDVNFDPATKSLSEIACYSQGTFDCPPLLGIYDGMSETDTLKMLGDPSHEQMYGMVKKINYEKLGAWFNLTKTKVYMLAVTNVAPAAKAPPCKNRSPTCAPWERDWGDIPMKPGTTVTSDGTIVESPTTP